MSLLGTTALLAASGTVYASGWLATSRVFFVRWRGGWMDQALRQKAAPSENDLRRLAADYQYCQQGTHKRFAVLLGAVWPVSLPLHLTFRDPAPSLLEVRARQEIDRRRVEELERQLDRELGRFGRDDGRDG